MAEIVETHVCSRCRRERRVKFMIQRVNRSGKKVWRCRKLSVCATKGRRLREKIAAEKKL